MIDGNGAGWNRRQMLAGGLLAGMATAFPARAATFFGTSLREKGRAVPGIQLYPLSDAVTKDVDATFARLAAMGYRAVETAGFHGKRPQELKAAADRAGLTIVSAHVQPQLRMAATDRTLSDPDLGALVDDLNALGVRQVVMPLPLLSDDVIAAIQAHGFEGLTAGVAAFKLADWQRSAAFLNQRGEALRAAGLALSYHNHNMEFAPVEGTTGWDVLMRETNPSLVGFEMDVGWVAASGRDPVEVLRHHPGRVKMLHVKDVDPSTTPNYVGQQVSAPVGKGVVRWPELLHLARAQAVTGYFVEQEPPFVTDAFDAMAQSIAYLKGLK